MSVALQATEEQFYYWAIHMKKLAERTGSAGYRRFLSGKAFSPAVNLYEDGEAYHVAVDLAAVSPKSMSLEVNDGKLVLSGERATPRPPGSVGVACMHLMEIDHGPFHRVVEIPKSVDASRVTATYRCGLLWICLPKST